MHAWKFSGNVIVEKGCTYHSRRVLFCLLEREIKKKNSFSIWSNKFRSQYDLEATDTHFFTSHFGFRSHCFTVCYQEQCSNGREPVAKKDLLVPPSVMGT